MPIIITSLTILIMLILLIKEIFDPLKVFILAVSVFLVAGYITIDEAVVGFSNKGVLAVAVLFIIAGAIEGSSYFHNIAKFGGLGKERFNPLKLFITITGLSAFLNNTPIVSMFIPIVKIISGKTGLSASKLLIPISYLSLLGGMLTLIGTSTNLVISGLMEDYGMKPLAFFELTKVSMPCVLFGIIYIYLFHKKRLPDNSDILESSIKQTNEHFIRFLAKKESSIIGKTVQEAKLRALSGVYLVEIERNGTIIFPVTPYEIVKENDLLIFAGQIDQIDELKNIDNLVLETDYDFNTNYFNHKNTVILEAVITQPLGSPNYTIKELKFREKYNAVVIGIIRNGERLPEKLGAIHPKLGDILLLIAEKGTLGLIESDQSLTVINKEERKSTGHTKKSIFPFIALICTIFPAFIFNLNILYTALLGIAFLLLTDTIQIKDALHMIEYKTIILIALSFSIGTALINTGTALFIAKSLSPVISQLHPILLLMIAYVITNLFANIITNNAAAILALPIVYEIASVSSYDIRPFMLITAIAASASLLSPYAYQTNTMVYGAGGYKYKDFIIFGYPLTIILLFTSSITTYLLFF